MKQSATRLAVGLALASVAADARADERKACDAAYDQAQTLRDGKKLVAAREQLRVCARPACASSVVKECTAWLADAEARIPSVIPIAVDASGSVLPDVSVTMDGGGAPRKVDGTSWDVDPGQHSFSFAMADGTKLDKSVVVIEGQKAQRVSVTASAHPAALAVGAPPAPAAVDGAPAASEPKGHTQRVLAVTSGGVGVAGILVGSIFGGLAFSSWSSFNGACPSHTNCAPSTRSSYDDASTFGAVSTAGFVVGGVLLAAGVTLWFTAPKDAAPAVSVGVAPGGASVTGRF